MELTCDLCVYNLLYMLYSLDYNYIKLMPYYQLNSSNTIIETLKLSVHFMIHPSILGQKDCGVQSNPGSSIL